VRRAALGTLAEPCPLVGALGDSGPAEIGASMTVGASRNHSTAREARVIALDRIAF